MADLVALLRLTPHREGGYYRETYRSAEKISRAGLPTRFSLDADTIRVCTLLSLGGEYVLISDGSVSR